MDSNCRAEVRRLHEFFVEWFNDDREHPHVESAYVEGVLHPDFSMVLPSGVTIDRTVALEQILAAHASATGPGDVAIEIVRAPDAPHGVQWYRLHDTLLAAG